MDDVAAVLLVLLFILFVLKLAQFAILAPTVDHPHDDRGEAQSRQRIPTTGVRPPTVNTKTANRMRAALPFQKDTSPTGPRKNRSEVREPVWPKMGAAQLPSVTASSMARL
jgi:hypothetical protein